ncbi:MAG: DUF4826 family protein [Shewanella sp.]|uniref:DUF4826 family protein n=1 Tax=Shewanella sp. SNU WT4 TaxID=2590015 RepID=UPI001129A608|nr:DUF4826 family protein [Shewanella sp. SNU WT4]QDF67317.1 DUF4826 family protein [Shewanella sp. SNU WT4]
MTDKSAVPETLTPEQQQALEQQREIWVREQFQKANRFLAEKGIIPGKVLVDQSRYLAPYVAVWKMETAKPAKKTYWVISGDLPTDVVEVGAAANPREVLRHFSLNWQLKAENLIRSGAVRDKTQAKFANLLISRAQSLYLMQNDEALWA